MPTRIAVLCSFNMDLVMRTARPPEAGETVPGEFAFHLGGKGFNQAVAARRIGAEVIVAGRVGDDEFGRTFLRALDAEGINRGAVVVDPEAGTGVASITVAPDGSNRIVQASRANRNVSRADWETGFDARVYDDASVSTFFDDVDFALVNLENDSGAPTDFFRDMFLAEKRDCTMLNASPAGPVAKDLLSFTSTIVVNETEAELLTGIAISEERETALSAARALASTVQTAVITLGARGAVAVRAGTRVHVPAFDVPVVDTTGAGDAFCSALAVSLNERSLADAVRFANAAGALACTRMGAEPSMPLRSDVEALIATGVTRG